MLIIMYKKEGLRGEVMETRIILQNLSVALAVGFMGILYYMFSVSKSKDAQNMAFFMKIIFLIISLLLAFTRQEFISFAGLSFGGRTSVMVLVVIEIADAFIDRKNSSAQLNKRKRHNSDSGMKMKRK